MKRCSHQIKRSMKYTTTCNRKATVGDTCTIHSAAHKAKLAAKRVDSKAARMHKVEEPYIESIKIRTELQRAKDFIHGFSHADLLTMEPEQIIELIYEGRQILKNFKY